FNVIQYIAHAPVPKPLFNVLLSQNDTILEMSIVLRELQEINYPILWGGHLARHIDWAGEMPTPQELIGYFFIWKSLIPNCYDRRLSHIRIQLSTCP
ncbi:hypothetical protein, partial [Nostoc sp.]|uniref:hypothetical protein n=1 Tax=Nostoc sp. TaxID=1180 RepID=UPI002FF63538